MYDVFSSVYSSFSEKIIIKRTCKVKFDPQNVEQTKIRIILTLNSIKASLCVQKISDFGIISYYEKI